MAVMSIGLGSFQVLGMLMLAVLPVRVSTNSGETIRGNLLGIGESVLRIERDGKTMKIPFEDAVALKPTEDDDATGPTFRVMLLGGSQIAAQDLTLSDEELVIEPRRQKEIRVNVKLVKSIRFRAPSPTTNAQWLGLVEQEGQGDVMAIRREGDRMDPYRGIIQSISDGKVGFDLSGDAVSAPIEKLEGLVFGGNRAIDDGGKIKVSDVYGSQWVAKTILPSEDGRPIKLQLAGSVSHEIPLSHIASISWASGLQWLSSTKAAKTSYQPYFQPKEGVQLSENWFAPDRDGESDLLMYGSSWIEYRVEPGFAKLTGSVQRDESVDRAGRVFVSVLLDDKVQWREELLGAQLLGFDLPLGDARRIRIEVNSDDGDFGDTVRVIRPRLLK